MDLLPTPRQRRAGPCPAVDGKTGDRMYPTPFALERFFARHEFSARYLLSAYDCQGPSMAELVATADDELPSVSPMAP